MSPLPNNGMQRTALRAAADAERYAKSRVCHCQTKTAEE